MAILTPEQAREAANKLGLSMLATNNQANESMTELIQQLNDTPLNGEGMEELGSLLALPDAQFSLIAPAFLEELQKTYNTSNTQLMMVQAMNLAGKHAEDMQEEYLAICKAVDELVGPQLSAPKRDFLKELIGLTYNSIAGAEGIAKKTINIPLEYCHPDAKMPAYAHLSDAGMDVYALDEITINPGETKLIPTGIKVAIPLGYELQVRPKSGRCLKSKLRIANTPGTIDAGYRDEIKVIVENVDPPIRAIHFHDDGTIGPDSIEYGQSYVIGKGEKFAQLVLSEVPKVCWTEVERVSDVGEDRGGGFGSTGLK